VTYVDCGFVFVHIVLASSDAAERLSDDLGESAIERAAICVLNLPGWTTVAQRAIRFERTAMAPPWSNGPASFSE